MDVPIGEPGRRDVAPFKTQLLKWVGNKQKIAHLVIAAFPKDIGTYREPFLGSGAVMATLAPERAVGSDVFGPLMEIWQKLSEDPQALADWYATRYAAFEAGDRRAAYEMVRAAYNARPNGADLLFLSRACYGGVVRFRRRDGHMSTPCGVHPPIRPETFAHRVGIWRERMAGARFRQADFADAMACAEPGDLVYCDPPYADSQSILYGAQRFQLDRLFAEIAACKARGVRVALSLDGTKKSGAHACPVDLPPGLFTRSLLLDTGRSMLRRFQMGGRTLEHEGVQDRLLLTY